MSTEAGWLVAVAICGIAYPGAALARDCAAALQSAADAVSRLPGDTPYEVPDQLLLYHDEATELVDADPAACLVIAGRMNALIAQYLPGGPGSGQATGARTAPRPTTARPAVPDADRVLADLRTDDEERLRRRIERASEDEGEHLEAVGAYRDAARSYADAMRCFAVSQRSAPAELSEIDAAVRDIDTLTREFEQIVILNAPDDVMHARLEDAVLRVTEARRALERAWQRYHARKAAAADDYIAPLTSPGFQPAALVDDFLAPLGDAATRAAQSRLRMAERALKQVRNSWDPHVHRRDWPFVDMREGYKQAYRSEHDGFADELKAFDATLDSYAPDRIAEFTRRRSELSGRHERRLDAIFERFAIR